VASHSCLCAVGRDKRKTPRDKPVASHSCLCAVDSDKREPPRDKPVASHSCLCAVGRDKRKTPRDKPVASHSCLCAVGRDKRKTPRDKPVASQSDRSHCHSSVSSNSRVISIIVGRKPLRAKRRWADSFLLAVDSTMRGTPRDFRREMIVSSSNRPTPWPRYAGSTIRSFSTPAGPRSDM